MIGALGLGLGGLAAVADVPSKSGVSCTPSTPVTARAPAEVPALPKPDVVPAGMSVPPLTLPMVPPPAVPPSPPKLPEVAAAPALPLVPPPAPAVKLAAASAIKEPALPPPPPVPTAAPVVAPAGTPLYLPIPVPADGGAGSFQRYEVTFKPPMLEAKPTLPSPPAAAATRHVAPDGTRFTTEYRNGPAAVPAAFTPEPPNPAFTEPPLPKPIPAAPTPPAVPAAEKKLKVLLHMGDERPKFEIRDGDEVYLKVTSDKVDVKSPGDAGANMSTMRATGKVTFVTPGGEGTCTELNVVPGTGQVVVTGQVNFTYNWGKVETTVSGEKMTFRLGSTPGVGPAVAVK